MNPGKPSWSQLQQLVSPNQQTHNTIATISNPITTTFTNVEQISLVDINLDYTMELPVGRMSTICI